METNIEATDYRSFYLITCKLVNNQDLNKKSSSLYGYNYPLLYINLF